MAQEAALRQTARRGWARIAATGVFVLFSLMNALFSVSVFFVEDPFERDAQVLISTFGVGMAVFSLFHVAGLWRGSKLSWIALWAWPLFFIVQIVGIGHAMPTLVFALVAVGVLLASARDM